MQVKANSGLNPNNLQDIKVFLRTYNDALECAQAVAMRDVQVRHYKSYIKTLIDAVKKDKVNLNTLNDPLIANH